MEPSTKQSKFPSKQSYLGTHYKQRDLPILFSDAYFYFTKTHNTPKEVISLMISSTRKSTVRTNYSIYIYTRVDSFIPSIHWRKLFCSLFDICL